MLSLLFAWLYLTNSGWATRAVAQNLVGARVVGISPGRIYMVVFGISAALGAAGGAVATFVLSLTPTVGLLYVIKGFAVVILGGMGSLVGTLLGALLLGLAESVAGAYIPSGGLWSEGLSYLALILVLVIRPQGIMGRWVERV